MTSLVLGLCLSAGPSAPSQLPGDLPPPPVLVPAPAPVALTLDQFSRVFVPTPGPHGVWIVHPRTCQPVHVCFTLPCGKLRKTEVNRRSIEFDFAGAKDVEIIFRLNGTADVKYR